MKNHRYIVFGVEHYNPLGVVRSLGEAGIKPVVIVIKGGPRLTSQSKFCHKVYYVNNHKEGLRILLNDYVDEKNKAFLFTCDDNTMKFLDEHFEDLKNNFYFFNAGAKNRISYYLNKENIGKLAVENGLNFLPNIVVNTKNIPGNLNYPIITKAIDSTVGAWKKDMFICNNENELREACKQIKSPTIMIQKYIKKENEYCLEGFSCNQGKDIFISIESTYDYKLPLSYSPYMTVNNFRNKNNIMPALRAMFSKIKFEGIFEVEFLESKSGDLYFGEINFRNSTWSYASTCAGMNLPILWAKSMLEGEIPKDCNKPIKMPGFKAMVELTDFKERVLKKKYNPIKWLRELNECKCKYYIGKRDWKPVLITIMDRIIGK